MPLRTPHRLTALVSGLTLVALAATLAPAQSPQLAAVYTQMDAAAKHFTSATASVERDNFERVVRDTTVEKGTMYLDRGKGGLEFGATVSAPGGPSPARIVHFADGRLELYTPATHQVDVFKAGANGNTLEGYLALGFGGTSKALTSAWTVTDQGPETLTDSGSPVKTEKLLLVSKDPGVRNTFKQITLWLDPTRDVSVKQFFETPSGDTQTATYSNIRLNGKLNKGAYKIPSGKDVTVVNH